MSDKRGSPSVRSYSGCYVICEIFAIPFSTRRWALLVKLAVALILAVAGGKTSAEIEVGVERFGEVEERRYPGD